MLHVLAYMFSFIGHFSRVVGKYSYSMPKRNNLMFWGSPKRNGVIVPEKVALKFSYGINRTMIKLGSGTNKPKSGSLLGLAASSHLGQPIKGSLVGGSRLGTRRAKSIDESQFPVLEVSVYPGLRYVDSSHVL